MLVNQYFSTIFYQDMAKSQGRIQPFLIEGSKLFSKSSWEKELATLYNECHLAY